jgi:hypothetical protein
MVGLLKSNGNIKFNGNKKVTELERVKLESKREDLLKESIMIMHTTRAPWNRDQRHARANALRLLAGETL